jgi:hypothetical protein
MTESVFLNIITNGLYTYEHYIVVAADSGGKRVLMKKTSAILRAYTN